MHIVRLGPDTVVNLDLVTHVGKRHDTATRGRGTVPGLVVHFARDHSVDLTEQESRALWAHLEREAGTGEPGVKRSFFDLTDPAEQATG